MSLVQNRIERYVPVPYDKLNDAKNRYGEYRKIVRVNEDGSWRTVVYEDAFYKVHELATHTSQKSYNKRAYVLWTPKGWYLFSYGTLVAVAFGSRNIFIKKGYLGNSYRTTTKHIKSFVAWCTSEDAYFCDKLKMPTTKDLLANYEYLSGHIIGAYPDDDYNAFCYDKEAFEIWESERDR